MSSINELFFFSGGGILQCFFLPHTRCWIFLVVYEIFLWNFGWRSLVERTCEKNDGRDETDRLNLGFSSGFESKVFAFFCCVFTVMLFQAVKMTATTLLFNGKDSH